MLSIALENKQVEYILKDEDIHDLYAVICDGTDSEEAKKFVTSWKRQRGKNVGLYRLNAYHR